MTLLYSSEFAIMIYFFAGLTTFLLALLVSRTGSLIWILPAFAFVIFAPDFPRALIVCSIIVIMFFTGIAIDARVKPHPQVLTKEQVSEKRRKKKYSQWPYAYTFQCCDCFYRFKLTEHDSIARDGNEIVVVCPNCDGACWFRKPTFIDKFLGTET